MNAGDSQFRTLNDWLRVRMLPCWVHLISHTDADDHAPAWEFVVAPPRSAPGVVSMVGYRAVDVPDAVHRGLPSSLLTFMVSLDDGVEAA
jgi:hypothetical protein